MPGYGYPPEHVVLHYNGREDGSVVWRLGIRVAPEEETLLKGSPWPEAFFIGKRLESVHNYK